jgi:hypothetical protein
MTGMMKNKQPAKAQEVPQAQVPFAPQNQLSSGLGYRGAGATILTSEGGLPNLGKIGRASAGGIR